MVNEDDLQKADPEEQRKIDAIAQEKEVYKQNFESATAENGNRACAAHAGVGRKKLQKEYDEWYAHVLRQGHNKQPTERVGDAAASPAARRSRSRRRRRRTTMMCGQFYAAKAGTEARSSDGEGCGLA